MSQSDSIVVKPEVVSIDEVLNEIKAGKIRVPKFQRPFVWSPQQMLDLFDSIYKGYPIGSPLIWESSETIETFSEFGPFNIPGSKISPLSYILDGHQRLLTLYSGLKLAKDAPLTKEQRDWCWWIWFDLENRVFVHVNKGVPKSNYLPVRALLETVDYLKECKRLQEDCPEQSDVYISIADALVSKIKNYRFAVTRIKEGSKIQAVTIFSRLNTMGAVMAPDQMLSALTYNKQGGLSLADGIDNILRELSDYHFGGIERRTILNVILPTEDINTRKNGWENLANRLGDNISNEIETAKNSLVAAAVFLSDNLLLGATGDKLLPYSNQLLLLSEFFRNCPFPSENQKAYLVKWFWSTSFSGWFAGANTTNIRHALLEMKDFAEDETQLPKIMSLDDPARPFPIRFDMRSARVRTLLIFCVSLSPLDPATAEPLDACEIIRRYKDHPLPYVFPRVPSGNNLISNPANRIILEKPRNESVKEILIAVEAQHEDEDIRRILESHGISQQAYDALKRDDAKGFIESRAEYLEKLENQFMEQIGVTPPETIGGGEPDIDIEE